MPNTFLQLFPRPKPLIGMIHLKALPGTPAYTNNDEKILQTAIKEAIQYKKAGIDGLIIENMHDTPYLNQQIGPEIITAMTIAAYEIKKTTQLPCGIQVLAAANHAALAIAKAAKLEFIRAEGFIYAHIADEGYINAQAGPLLRYRKQINAEHIHIITDIKKKHSAHEITQDISLIQTAQTAEYFRSDGLIITGNTTGQAAKPEHLIDAKKHTQLPILIGSGITPKNIAQYFHYSDGFIVGSYFKKGGCWRNEVKKNRVKKLIHILEKLRKETKK